MREEIDIKLQNRAMSRECQECECPMETRAIPIRGYVLPTGLLLSGSLLSLYLVGWVLIAAGLVCLLRRRDVLFCPGCSLTMEASAGNRRARG